MTRIFIDGKAGTTGLRLAERLKGRKDLEILELAEENRKDLEKIPPYVLEKFTVVPVREIEQVLETALKRD